jgi:hypothetical protein
MAATCSVDSSMPKPNFGDFFCRVQSGSGKLAMIMHQNVFIGFFDLIHDVICGSVSS